jgi:predicted RNase H-like HicB family nuclease
MNNTYTAIIKQDGNWWIGWFEEVPGTNCQEETREALIESLRDVLREALEFDGLLTPGVTYEVFTPYGNSAAAKVLSDFIVASAEAEE